jgi:hypothetical protein
MLIPMQMLDYGAMHLVRDSDLWSLISNNYSVFPFLMNGIIARSWSPTTSIW